LLPEAIIDILEIDINNFDWILGKAVKRSNAYAELCIGCLDSNNKLREKIFKLSPGI
jgi:hypothetical protein